MAFLKNFETAFIQKIAATVRFSQTFISQMKVDPRSYERNYMQLRKEAWKKFRTSTGFEPVTSRYRCDALTNWAMKPLTLGAGQL